tara:strand:- start:1099 stop:2643 length:1545 start_codon:yes stop_codon:yes gene_type:complete
VTLIKFARMCEALEELPPTAKKSIINRSLSSFNNKSDVIKILALEYNINNIAERKAIKWIADSCGVFESEIEDYKKIWSDLAQGMFYFSISTSKDSGISIKEFTNLLELNCASIQGTSFPIISEAIQRMSNLELKWFIRYWLRVPRNGVGNGVITQSLNLHYKTKINKIKNLHSFNYITNALESGKTLSNEVKIGSPIKPMLAKTMTTKNLEKIDKYILDIKYDGNRYIIHRQDPSILIFNRSGKLIDSNRYSDIVDIIKELDCNNSILDTEIYPVNVEGNPVAHQKLGTRVHSLDIEKAKLNCPVKVAIFDTLLFKGTQCIDEPYESRLKLLQDNINSEYLARTFTGDIESAYNIAINDNFEGIMIKDLSATYQLGKRSTALLKHKPARINLDLVVTSAKYGEGKRAGWFGSFGLSAKNDEGDYTTVGYVGSGFSEAELMSLTTKLKKIVDVYDVKSQEFFLLPRIVLEVLADAITKDSDGNIGLRFPRLIKIRDDKFAVDSNTIADLEELME